ncbi:MAG: O-antigen ligase family protein [Lachnospiraceae bacterium]|nr:O-antigen ligase family protein [Lachnospiraceae bacterium]
MISRYLKKSINFILTSYIFIIAVIYPLFMTSGGYSSIGNDKYNFYRTATLAMLVLVLIFVILFWLCNKKESPGGTASKIMQVFPLNGLQSFIWTQWAAIIFLAIAAVSWFFSSYRTTAWQGAAGWFIGLETLLFMVFTYFLISFLWKYYENIWLFFLAGSGITFILGILNRFSFYLFEFDLMAPHFISTLGNINWGAGYFSVMWPVGVGLYLFSGKRYQRYSAGVYTFIAMSYGIVQGADSAFLSFGAVFFLLFIICLGQWEKYGASYLELIMAWCLTCQFMRLVRVILPTRFNYGAEGIGGFLTDSNLSIYLLLLVIIPYLLTKTKADFFFRFINNRLTKKIVIFVPIVAILIFTILIIVNTITPNGIGLTEMAVFTYNENWGSSRGATWNLGVELFIRMNPVQKLIGLGPDCFSEYLYSFPDLISLSNEYFGMQLLKNAHNETLTTLVNVGILGTLAYFSIFVTFFVRFVKQGKANAIMYIPAVCVFSYVIHNMVSFGQILNLPFIFIIMGIGENSKITSKVRTY